MPITFSTLARDPTDAQEDHLKFLASWRSNNWDYTVYTYRHLGYMDPPDVGCVRVTMFDPDTELQRDVKTDLTCVPTAPLVDLIAGEVMGYICKYEPDRADLSFYLDKLRSGCYEILTLEEPDEWHSDTFAVITLAGYAGYKQTQERNRRDE